MLPPQVNRRDSQPAPTSSKLVSQIPGEMDAHSFPDSNAEATSFPEKVKFVAPRPKDEFDTAPPPTYQPARPAQAQPVGRQQPSPVSKSRLDRPFGDDVPDPKTPQAAKNSVPVDRPDRVYPASGLCDDNLKTIGRMGRDLSDLSSKVFVLRYCHFLPGQKGTSLRILGMIEGGSHVVGRKSFVGKDSTVIDFLAEEHLRIIVEDGEIFVEEGKTINGVYLKIPPKRPIELKPGVRFAVGEQLVELEMPLPELPETQPMTRDRETLRWRKLEPLAYLRFVGPDNDEGIRFPITKSEGVTIGREGEISLGTDRVGSRLHTRVFRRGDHFYLEDMGSTNGTFVRISERTPIRPGTSQNPLAGDELLIGAVLLRVIEE